MKNGRFDNMEFGKYEFQEFPKWVDAPNGARVVVNSAEEEAAVVAPPKRGPGRPPKA